MNRCHTTTAVKTFGMASFRILAKERGFLVPSSTSRLRYGTTYTTVYIHVLSLIAPPLTFIFRCSFLCMIFFRGGGQRPYHGYLGSDYSPASGDCSDPPSTAMAMMSPRQFLQL
jgi:hypothetical protein